MLMGNRVWRWLALAVAAAIAPTVSQTALAQDFPNRPIRLVVPFAAQGATDSLTRIFAQRLSDGLGQPVNIENSRGQGGMLGAEQVAKAAPDGYTLLIGTVTTHATGPALQKRPPYDPIKDFTAIAYIGWSPHVLVSTPAIPVKSLPQFIAHAKAQPYGVTFASGGNGSFSHLMAEQLRGLAGVELQHAAYKGLALALPDLMTGSVSMMFETLAAARTQAKLGTITALALTSSRRSLLWPELPTLSEAGVEGFNAVSWFGMFAPAKLPEPVLQRLEHEVGRALHAPEVRQGFSDLGAELEGQGAVAFARFVEQEFSRWSQLVRDARLQAE